ncbi:velvet factor-domain-containing protein, partial [Phlebopus sp. FC_14]
ASPNSVASSEHSGTQSPPSAWGLPPQAETSGHGQNTTWSNVSTTDRPASQFPLSQPRVHSSFLNDNQTRSYQLDVVQHPQRTAEFGSASLSRLPLAPPVVVQLIVRDRFGNSIIPEMELPFLVAHLSLFSDDGSRPLDMESSPSGNAPRRRLLYGNLVSSPQKLRDLQGRLGLYFLFPDVSIRWRGRFQLGISLLRISQIDASGVMSIASQGTVLAQARTRPFDVLTHENYVAPPTTRLTQSFLRQGARIHAFTPNSP